jgi:hypothetical protein
MSDAIGPVYLGSTRDAAESASQDTRHRMDAEVSSILRTAYERVKQLLVRCPVSRLCLLGHRPGGGGGYCVQVHLRLGCELAFEGRWPEPLRVPFL